MTLRRLLTCSLLLGALAAPASSQSLRQTRMNAVAQMIEGLGDDAAFVREHLAPAYRDSFEDHDAVLEHLRELRVEVGPIGDMGVTIAGNRVQLVLSGPTHQTLLAFTLEEQAPQRITRIWIESKTARKAGPEVTWETIEDTLEEAEAEGFCGSVIAVRDGQVVLERGFGFADPEREHPVTKNTIFAIGSTPIDFTHAAILRLEQDQMLSLDDTIGMWFEDVPEDKQGITLAHLRTGRSGLLDFPALDGVDENRDLSWIDRDEFLRRIFASQLLFEPGTNERHSHAAWGLLAAVIEVASDQGYEAYLREHFFEPAGMQRTGHYPLTRAFPEGEVAVGLGGNVWGEVNAPQYWGETSWLVLGSGGMVSTPGDLMRWFHYTSGDEGLGQAARAKYRTPGGVFVGEGGNDRGFVNTIGSRGGHLVIVCSNSHVRMGDEAARIAMAVAEVAAGE